MPFRTVTIAELRSLPWSDATITSIAWVNGNRDLRLSIELGDRRKVTCDFCWADRLRVDLSYGEHENFPPFAWDARIEEAAGGRGSLAIDFGRQGSVSLAFESVMAEGS